MREMDDVDINNELWEYLEDYRKRHRWYAGRYEQILPQVKQKTLQECFPELFAD